MRSKSRKPINPPDQLPAQILTVGDNGEDFSTAEIETLTLRIAAWYRSEPSGRKYDDPAAMAAEHVRQCLLAINDRGTKWVRCPVDFKKRIRVKCNYDVDSERGIPRHKQKLTLGREVTAAVRDMDPVATVFDRTEFEKNMVAQILLEYPELDNAVHRLNVEQLAMIYAEQQGVRAKLKLMSAGAKSYGDLLENLTKLEQSAERTMKLLDIHPDQLRKKADRRREGTAGDLIATLEEDDFKERERLWAMQAALQFWWMCEHPNGRGDGPQILPWEMWHMTRSVPMTHRCPGGDACGKEVTLIHGFTPAELKQYLLTRGCIKLMEPAIPKLITPEDLVGLDGDWEDAVIAEDEES